MKYLLVLIGSLVLSAPCIAQPNYPTGLCMDALGSDARFETIRGKLALADVKDTTFAMFALQQVPTPDEKNAIAQWADAREACFKRGAEFRRAELSPEHAALMAEIFTAGQQLGKYPPAKPGDIYLWRFRCQTALTTRKSGALT